MNFFKLVFSVVKKAIVLPLICFFLSISASAQEKNTITGKVTDNGVPLENVSVNVSGTNTGTTTDEQGRFHIMASKGQTLTFSYIGYETKSFVLDDHLDLSIDLSASADDILGEVVVVAYGTQKKENLSGAVSTVSAKEIESRPVTNVTTALQGTMAGVTIVQNSGQPGKDLASVRVRGIGTLGNSDAMIIVDGVVSSMNDVNPNDIQTITVLKDAASASIYGSRAANGVILITTKKGKKGETIIHYNGYVGKQSPTNLPDFLPSWKAATFFNEALANEGQNPRYTAEEIEKFKNGSDPDNYANTDWLDLFYQGSGLQQSHYVDVSGGNEKSQTLVSFGYYQQEGIVKNTGLDRYTTRFKNSTKLGSRFAVNTSLAYSLQHFQEPANPLGRGFDEFFWQINRIGRNVPYKYSTGHYGYNDDGNPLAWIESGSNFKNRTHTLRGIIDGDLEIIDGLHFKPLLGYNLDLNQSKEFVKDIQYYNWRTGEPTIYQGPNNLTENNDYLSVVTLQALLQYTKKFGENEFNVLGGYSQEKTQFNYLRGYRFGFLNNSLSELDAGPVTGQETNGSSYQVGLQSFFGRINYSFRDKYLLEANIRNDGSSRFAKGKRWGTYPSFSAAWRLSEEPFFDALTDVISEFKLRASWGMLGNQNIGSYYPYIATIASGMNYSFGNAVANGVAPVNGANSMIQWEDTKSTNKGFDAAILGGKITLTSDYFIRTTSNMLMDIPVSNVYGFNPPVQNAGNIENKGFELELAYHGRGTAFTFDISGNASFITNTVTNLEGTDPIINGYTFLKVGYPINSFYGYEAEGIFQTQREIDNHAQQSGGVIAPGDLMYKDQNGDNVINGDDRVYLGTYFPKVTYGLNVSMGWKGFDATVFLQGAAGVKGFLRGEVMGMTGDKIGKPTSIFEERWTPDNPTDEFPRFWNAYSQNNPTSNASSFWIRDAGYMRVKNVQVGYTFSSRKMEKMGLKKARIFYSGQNIFTVTQFYDWVDPEAPAGETGYTYPQVKVNTLGVNLTF
jgi:TonB-linked SusC/RagA family outer membrane protein